MHYKTVTLIFSVIKENFYNRSSVVARVKMNFHIETEKVDSSH